MATVPASSHGTTFNGGTITAPLVIAPAAPSAAPLTVRAPTGLITSGFDLVEVLDETSLDRLEVFADGGLSTHQATGEVSRLRSGAGEQIEVSDGVLGMNLGGGGSWTVGDHTGTALVSAADSGRKLGFYGHAAAAQSSITSGTVTPEQLALALQANGALGGT